MLKINVLQNDGELLGEVLSRAFKECRTDVEFSDASEISVFTAGTKNCACSSKIAISPDAKNIKTDAHEVITYGLCCKNTLTISSCIGGNMILSLQRAILTLTGNFIDVQDFPITVSDPTEPEVVLATVATLLACDIPISVISKLPF